MTKLQAGWSEIRKLSVLFNVHRDGGVHPPCTCISTISRVNKTDVKLTTHLHVVSRLKMIPVIISNLPVSLIVCTEKIILLNYLHYYFYYYYYYAQQLGFILCLITYNFLKTLGICTWFEFCPLIQKVGWNLFIWDHYIKLFFISGHSRIPYG